MVTNSARNDQLKVVQIGRDVEGKTMHRHPAGDSYPEGRQLIAIDPDADIRIVVVVARRDQPKLGRGSNQDLLKITDIASDVAAVRREINDRITDQLPRAMIGDVPAPPGLVKFDTRLAERRLIGQNVRPFGRPTERDDVRMFEKEERVWNLVTLPLTDQLLLQRVCLGVGYLSQYFHPALSHKTVGDWRDRLWHLRVPPNTVTPIPRNYTSDEKSVVSMVFRMWAINWSATAPSMIR